MQADHCISSQWKQEDDVFMVLGSLYVDVSSPRQVIGMTDKWMAFQLYVYR